MAEHYQVRLPYVRVEWYHYLPAHKVPSPKPDATGQEDEGSSEAEAAYGEEDGPSPTTERQMEYIRALEHK